MTLCSGWKLCFYFTSNQEMFWPAFEKISSAPAPYSRRPGWPAYCDVNCSMLLLLLLLDTLITGSAQSDRLPGRRANLLAVLK